LFSQEKIRIAANATTPILKLFRNENFIYRFGTLTLLLIQQLNFMVAP